MRTEAEMPKTASRKVKVLFFASGLTVVMLCVGGFYLFAPPRDDEARYRDMQRARKMVNLAMSLRRGPFRITIDRLDIEDRCDKRFHNDMTVLKKSGYLTNFFVSTANPDHALSVFGERYNSGSVATNIYIGGISPRTNGLWFFCRAKDIPRLRKMMEE